MVDCALIGLALSAFRSESILRDAVVPVPRPPANTNSLTRKDKGGGEPSPPLLYAIRQLAS